MIAISEDRLKKIIADNQRKIDQKIKERKGKLINSMLIQPRIIPLSSNELKYLELLVKDYEKIVLANPKTLIQYKRRFDNIIPANSMKNGHKQFKKELIKYMGYRTLRGTLYPKIFDKLEINSCVYCNSMLTVSVNKVKGQMTARYEVDHYMPKSIYPCFSTSYFNFYPSCGECNGRKSDNQVGFNLYTDNLLSTSKSSYHFYIDKKSLVKYKLDGNPQKLEIKFNEPTGSNFNDSFAIDGIYNTQRDLAEELVIKSMIYNKTYKESLKALIKKKYRDKLHMSNRLVIGNYADPKEIHKRPMAKFTQDLARQLNLIE